MMNIDDKIKKYKKEYDDLERDYNKTLKKDRKQVLHDKMIDIFARIETYKEIEKEMKLEETMVDLVCEEYYEIDNYDSEDSKNFWRAQAKRKIMEEEKEGGK